MTIDDKIRDQKMQYDINSEAAKVSAISSRKICKYVYLTSEEILPYNQIQIIQQATYSTLGKAFEKQTKTICDHGKKQIKKIEDHGKQLVESDEIIRKDFNINRYSITLEEKLDL